jgi:uncharacterized DUF497 family protein/predicted DNA binding CopG/RHH family protein
MAISPYPCKIDRWRRSFLNGIRRRIGRNQAKHGVSFSDAQHAFGDVRRVIAEDLSHSTPTERRYFCFGQWGGGVLTVRFTFRDDVIRIFGAGYGDEVWKSMKKPIKYTTEPLGDLQVVADFLPPPAELVFREETEKVTIALSKRSVAFFKQEARVHGTQYQRMIRALLDRYADAHASGKKRSQRSRG